MKLIITTLITIEDNEVQDIIHSFNKDPDKAKQEIIDQVNNLYGNEKLTFYSIQGIREYFDIIHLECREISLQPNSTQRTMKKKSKNPVYIPGQDKWSEHFPTPGKLSIGNFGYRSCDPNSDYNRLLRTQNKLKTKRE